MTDYMPVATLGKAVLMALSGRDWKTVRQVQREAQVYMWDAELGMSATASRLELYLEQGLIEKRQNENGATQYRLKVDIRFV